MTTHFQLKSIEKTDQLERSGLLVSYDIKVDNKGFEILLVILINEASEGKVKECYCFPFRLLEHRPIIIAVSGLRFDPRLGLLCLVRGELRKKRLKLI